jgi:hypothetical protein
VVPVNAGLASRRSTLATASDRGHSTKVELSRQRLDPGAPAPVPTGSDRMASQHARPSTISCIQLRPTIVGADGNRAEPRKQGRSGHVEIDGEIVARRSTDSRDQDWSPGQEAAARPATITSSRCGLLAPRSRRRSTT